MGSDRKKKKHHSKAWRRYKAQKKRALWKAHKYAKRSAHRAWKRCHRHCRKGKKCYRRCHKKAAHAYWRKRNYMMRKFYNRAARRWAHYVGARAAHKAWWR